MVPDWNLILTAAGLAVLLVGGFVKLRVDITERFAGVNSRLDKIETRLEGEETTREIRMRDVMHRYCLNECPHRQRAENTNPGAPNPLL